MFHYRNLKQCLQHGLVLDKIHRILQFNKAPWLKTYINLSMKQRAAADSDFKKNSYKLMINSVFSKAMENVDEQKDVKIINGSSSTNRKANLL